MRGSVLASVLLGILILGKIGDAIGLAYVDTNPLLVLILNANDLHCASFDERERLDLVRREYDSKDV